MAWAILRTKLGEKFLQVIDFNFFFPVFDLGYILSTVLLKSFHALEQGVKIGRVIPCCHGDLLAMPESLSKSDQSTASYNTYIARKAFASSTAPRMDQTAPGLSPQEE